MAWCEVKCAKRSAGARAQAELPVRGEAGAGHARSADGIEHGAQRRRGRAAYGDVVVAPTKKRTGRAGERRDP